MPASGRLAIAPLGRVEAANLARLSCGAMGAEAGERPTLIVASVADEATILGRFQRISEVRGAAGTAPMLRRGSGGGAVRVGRGTLWVQLRLPSVDALVPAAGVDKLLNRYVRPLLGALTRVSGAPASYFGRDWISVRQRPVAIVGFAHDGTSGRALFEAFVALETSLVAPGLPSRPSFLGKEPATLTEIAALAIDAEHLMRNVAVAYSADLVSIEEVLLEAIEVPRCADEPLEPPWIATRPEAIGLVGAGPDHAGVLRLGGELMASSDAVADVEAAVAAMSAPDEASVGTAVDRAFTAPGRTLFGVRDLASIRDVLLQAHRAG